MQINYKIKSNIINNYSMEKHVFDSVIFPVMFYDIEYQYPNYKILENRTLQFLVFDSFHDLISEPDKIFELASMYRMIDCDGIEYSTEYSKKYKLNIPIQITRQLDLESIYSILESWIKRLSEVDRQNIFISESIYELFYKIKQLEN